jgi:hypothetical protein
VTTLSKNDWILATQGSVPPSGWILVREAKSGKHYWANPNTLKACAPQTRLTDKQMDRVRRLAHALHEHNSTPVEKWFENMRRDQQPEGEIQTWEEIVDAYLAEVADRPSAQAKERHLIYGVLVSASMLPCEMCEPGMVMSMYPKAKGLAGLEGVVHRFRKRRFGARQEKRAEEQME